MAQCSLETETVEELTNLLLDLIDLTNEENRKKILQFVCGLLNTEEKENIKLAFKLSQKIKSAIDESKTHDPQLLQMLLLCVKSWSQHMTKDEKSVLSLIWSVNATSEAQSLAGQKVIQIFEDFLNDVTVVEIFTPKLHKQIEQQLQSKMSKERLVGNNLLNKLLDSIKDPHERELVNFSGLDFITYITIIQCLQVETTAVAPKDDKCGLIWMRPLYIRLLCEDNLLVRRWTLEYLMLNTTSSDLRRANLLIGFLKATNKIELHDLDTYALPNQLMTNFVQRLELKRFLVAFVKVSWLEVPFVRWLYSLDTKRVPQITQKILYQIVRLVKKIQNQTLRLWASEKLFTHFMNTIQELSLVEYLKFSLDVYDKEKDIPYVVERMLLEQIRKCKDISNQLGRLSREGFEKICSGRERLLDYWPYYQLFKKLQNVPKFCDGLWRLSFILMLHNKPEVVDLYHAEYDLNIELFQKCTNLKELQEHLLEKLNCKTEDEKLFLLQKSVDMFVVTRITDWSKIEEVQLSALELMEQGTENTFLHLTDILSSHNQKLQDDKIFDEILQKWNQYKDDYKMQRVIACRIFRYAETNLNIDERVNLVHEIIKKCKNNTDFATLLYNTNSIPKYMVLQNLIREGDPMTDEERIEFALAKQLSYSCCTIRRDAFIEYAYRWPSETLYEIFNMLIRINVSMNRNGVILENSKENRVQMRILRVLLHTNPNSKLFWTNKLWQLLLSSSSQPNKICYLYECLVAEQLPFDASHFEQLLERIELISNLESIQQDSIISVLYIYCMRKVDLLKVEHFQRVFEMLLNQQMNILQSETRGFIQLVLHKLALKCEEKKIVVPMAVALKTPPNIVFENKIIQTTIEVRLMLPAIMHAYPSDIILHIINAPIDEYRRPVWVDSFPMRLYDQFRKVFAQRSCTS
ncbi:uncharacterized protein LOC133839504 [Drosophila sulfurigaster albostrigata]|uniref:uncharacterized protein LOC133839504 n=1 Tax=Drosophila sulfurigaster albostrigata TaxID=89887 RepID=UPI002D21C7E8|nr:uncharacterized protein LOC133839504 [Drosophila sulfurigaster albostrigata]